MDNPEEQKLREAAARLEKQLAVQTIELQGKNRELEIEGALEKVRVRTMAMRSSAELSETSVVLYQQLKELKINAIRTSVGIFDDANDAVEFWTTFSDKLEEIKYSTTSTCTFIPSLKIPFLRGRRINPMPSRRSPVRR